MMKTIRRYFNSQPHKEADEFLFHQQTNSEYFNSQPHKEADRNFTRQESVGIISTHSLARRLTVKGSFCFLKRTHFNSQPHKEADP